MAPLSETQSSPRALLFEVSAEVCIRMGGIHTLLKSKMPYMRERWQDDYFLLGAYLPDVNYTGALEEVSVNAIPNTHLLEALELLFHKGVKSRVGYWLTEGRPLVILLETEMSAHDLQNYKNLYARQSNVSIPDDDFRINEYMKFAHHVEVFFACLLEKVDTDESAVIAHFHDYLASVAIPNLAKLPLQIVFTTHQTALGRILASKYEDYHARWQQIDSDEEYSRLSAYYRFVVDVEKLAAQKCDVLTTESNACGKECRQFFNRCPDLFTPNGFDYAPRSTDAERAEARTILSQRVRKHFQLDQNDNLCYFFSGGRYEYRNKGFGTIIKALGKLDKWLARNNPELTVVMFFITSQPRPVRATWLNTIYKWLSISDPSERDVFLHQVPEEYRRSSLVLDLKKNGLINGRRNNVKVIYHPEFLSVNSPSLKMDYYQFVAACDLGIFPSHYEPWGYTPMECMVAGVPAITSNVAGFGNYVQESLTPEDNKAGIFVLDRLKPHCEVDLCKIFQTFLSERKNLQTSLQALSAKLRWTSLISHYNHAYDKALSTRRVKIKSFSV